MFAAIRVSNELIKVKPPNNDVGCHATITTLNTAPLPLPLPLPLPPSSLPSPFTPL